MAGCQGYSLCLFEEKGWEDTVLPEWAGVPMLSFDAYEVRENYELKLQHAKLLMCSLVQAPWKPVIVMRHHSSHDLLIT